MHKKVKRTKITKSVKKSKPQYSKAKKRNQNLRRNNYIVISYSIITSFAVILILITIGMMQQPKASVLQAQTDEPSITSGTTGISPTYGSLGPYTSSIITPTATAMPTLTAPSNLPTISAAQPEPTTVSEDNNQPENQNADNDNNDPHPIIAALQDFLDWLRQLVGLPPGQQKKVLRGEPLGPGQLKKLPDGQMPELPDQQQGDEEQGEEQEQGDEEQEQEGPQEEEQNEDGEPENQQPGNRPVVSPGQQKMDANENVFMELIRNLLQILRLQPQDGSQSANQPDN